MKNAWRITEDLILRIRDQVKSKNADFLLVTLTNPSQCYPIKEIRKEFQNYIGVEDLFYPDRRIKRFGVRNGFEVLTLSKTFQTYADKHNKYLHGFKNTTLGKGHWNVEGHRLAAEEITKYLIPVLKSQRLHKKIVIVNPYFLNVMIPSQNNNILNAIFNCFRE